MNSVFVLLFCLAAAIAQQTPPGVLKHVIVTYRSPPHTAYDFLADLKIANRKESESDLTEAGKKAAFDFGSEINTKYGSLLGVSDWDKEGWSFGSSPTRTQNAALIFAAGLKQKENDKFKEWSQTERDAIKYEEVKDFEKFHDLKQCPGFVKSLKEVQSKIETLTTDNKDAVDAVANKYKIDKTKSYLLWIAYETFVNQKAANEFNSEMESTLPGLKKFSEGLLFASVSTDELKRKAGGRLLNNILNDLEATKNGKPLTSAAPGKENVKASFYAAPQVVVGAQVAVFNPEGTKYGGKPLTAETLYPEHGAAHIVELHQLNKDKSWLVRVLYRQNSKDDFKAAVFPGCGGALCDYDTFVKAVQGFRQIKEQLEADCKV